MTRGYGGPESGVPRVCTVLAGGVWITSGRAAVLEGPGGLAVIDPGDEPCGTPEEPRGPLADVAALVERTGRPLRWVLVTHSHPDHVANLAAFRRLGPARVVAHARSPVGPDVAVTEPILLEAAGGLEVIPTPGHSRAGDDLTFWSPASSVVFPGDLVQPKGETWERTFYPSPFVHFTDGDVYAASLERIAALPFATLVTGHREVRTGEAAQRWVELTLRSLRRVAEAVSEWKGPDDLSLAAPAVYRRLAQERGLPPEVVEARLAATPSGPSAFERFDLPGIAFYWNRRGLHGARGTRPSGS